MTKQHKKKQYYDCKENFKTTKQFSASLQKAVDVKGVGKSLIIRTALEMREHLATLADYLAESHHEAMVQENDGAFVGAEERHSKEEPDCSYCKAIAQARAILK